MKDYHLTILSPDGEVFNGNVICLSLRGAEGDLAVYDGHIPFITTVKQGKCTVTLPDETEVDANLDSGILDVGKEEVKLLIGDKNAFGDSFKEKNQS